MIAETADSDIRSGFAALVGRPNAGKSTLVNALVGKKVAITSGTPQTTRHRLRAVVDRDDAQLVLVDTPGLHKPIDALGEELNRSSLLALNDVDVACMVVDASADVGKGDHWVAQRVRASNVPAVLVLTKIDLVSEARLEDQRHKATQLAPFVQTLAVSSVEGTNLEMLIDTLVDLLPMGPRYFPRDMDTDQPLEVMLAEFIREKVLHNTREEVPHAVGVALEDLTRDARKEITTVRAIIYVERESQKGIIVGVGGEMIKRIGIEARVDLERLLGEQVHLDLRVKVKKDWRRDASQIRRFGYGEGL